MTVILTDVDDTTMLCSDILQQFLETEYGLVTDRRLSDHHDIPSLYNISIDETLEYIRCFHRSSWMRRLPPDPSAATVLPELYRQGYRFVAVTACLNEEPVVKARRHNLEEAFGFPWEEVRCLGLTRCKKAALESYPASIWVDDLLHHAVTGAEAGHRAFLLDKPYNRADHPDSVTRIMDWHELAGQLLSRS